MALRRTKNERRLLLAGVVGALLLVASVGVPGSHGCGGDPSEETDMVASAATGDAGDADAPNDASDASDACTATTSCGTASCADDEEEATSCTLNAYGQLTAAGASGTSCSAKDVFNSVCASGKAFCQKAKTIYCAKKPCLHFCTNHGLKNDSRCPAGSPLAGSCPKYWSCTATGNITGTGYSEDVGPDCFNVNPNGTPAVYTPNATYSGCL